MMRTALLTAVLAMAPGAPAAAASTVSVEGSTLTGST